MKKNLTIKNNILRAISLVKVLFSKSINKNRTKTDN